MRQRWDEMDDMDLRQMEAEMADDLRAMRSAATVYAERALERERSATAVRPVSRGGWLAWGAAVVAAAVLTVGGVRVLHRAPADASHKTPLASAPVVHVRDASSVSDEALLEQIQNDLSSGVPAAMEPLEATAAKSSLQAAKQSE